MMNPTLALLGPLGVLETIILLVVLAVVIAAIVFAIKLFLRGDKISQEGSNNVGG